MVVPPDDVWLSVWQFLQRLLLYFINFESSGWAFILVVLGSKGIIEVDFASSVDGGTPVDRSALTRELVVLFVGRVGDCGFFLRNRHSYFTIETISPCHVAMIFPPFDGWLHLPARNEGLFNLAGVEDSLLSPSEMLGERMVIFLSVALGSWGSAVVASIGWAEWNGRLVLAWIIEVKIKTIELSLLGGSPRENVAVLTVNLGLLLEKAIDKVIEVTAAGDCWFGLCKQGRPILFFGDFPGLKRRYCMLAERLGNEDRLLKLVLSE